MNITTYEKTSKGRDEIATRAYKLAPRLRTLLLLVSGGRTEEELLRSVAGLGLTASALAELVEQEFIVPLRSSVTLPEIKAMPAPEPEPAPAPAPAPAAVLPVAAAETPPEKFVVPSWWPAAKYL
ncbi:hypothetical protein HSX11_05370 [Oxalobacteraceae bacterium]|nr:hypothetical protein [Oxalobacteraceae bacterium]